jgi:diamine N-acetyltransferase
MTTDATPRAASGLSLKPVTFHNVRSIIALKVAEPQSSYVAPNATSIAEGLLNPGGWLRAVHHGDTPVGFVMLLDPRAPGALLRGPVPEDALFLWRFMIAAAYQGRGYGRGTLDLIVDHAKGAAARGLVTSVVPGPHSPLNFYLRYGFVPTGGTRANGTELALQLALA